MRKSILKTSNYQGKFFQGKEIPNAENFETSIRHKAMTKYTYNSVHLTSVLHALPCFMFRQNQSPVKPI